VDGDGAAAEVEVLDLQEPQLVLAEREPPEQLNRDLVAEAWLGRRSLSMTSGLYACGSTFLRFGGLIFAAGLSPSPRSSTAQAKNDLVTASLFGALSLDGEDFTRLPCSERRAQLEALNLNGVFWQTPELERESAINRPPAASVRLVSHAK